MSDPETTAQTGGTVDGTLAALAHAEKNNCCANDTWRGHLCEYHQGYEDGYDAAVAAQSGRDHG